MTLHVHNNKDIFMNSSTYVSIQAKVNNSEFFTMLSAYLSENLYLTIKREEHTQHNAELLLQLHR